MTSLPISSLIPSLPRPTSEPSRSRSEARSFDDGHIGAGSARTQREPDAARTSNVDRDRDQVEAGESNPTTSDFGTALEAALGAVPVAATPTSASAATGTQPEGTLDVLDGTARGHLFGLPTGSTGIGVATDPSAAVADLLAATPGATGGPGSAGIAGIAGMPGTAGALGSAEATTQPTALAQAGAMALAGTAGLDAADAAGTTTALPTGANSATTDADATLTGTATVPLSAGGDAGADAGASSGFGQSSHGTNPAAAVATSDALATSAASAVNAAAAGTSTTGAEAPKPPTATEAMTRQVFPEVTRISQTAAPGTHRLAITLHPEDLGEVKVTMIVRAGTLQVQLAADTPAARAALANGTSELHRMLEFASASDTRIVVRDASGATTDTRTGSGSGQSETGQNAANSQTGQGNRNATPESAEEWARGVANGSTTGSTTTRTRDGATEHVAPRPTTTTDSGRLDRLM